MISTEELPRHTIYSYILVFLNKPREWPKHVCGGCLLKLRP